MTALAILLFTCGADVESGPKVDAKIAELKVTFVTGTNEKKEIDLAADRKDEPTVYFFVNTAKFDRPVYRFMKEVDSKLAETNEKAHGYAIWIAPPDDQKRRLTPISESAKFAKTDIGWIAKATPEGWGLNDDAHLTVVVAKKAKVAKVFAWKSVNETDAKAVLEAIK
jgi:hypothetical protein